MNSIKNINSAELAAYIGAANDSIVFFHKELCPHCKNMEKVLGKFSAKVAGVEILGIDSSEASLQMEQYGVERVPSLLFVKDGKVAHVKTGLLNPKELVSLHGSL